MFRANVCVIQTPIGRQSGVGMCVNALDDNNSQRSAGPTMVSVLANIRPSVLRFPGNELAGDYLYFKSPYTDPSSHTLVDTVAYPANIPGYFNSATNTLHPNVMNILEFSNVATGAGANVILSVSCIPSVNTNLDELANVATGLSAWCETRKIHPYAFELNDPNATSIAAAIRSANASFRIYTQGVGNVVANGYWYTNQPVSNARASINTSSPGNWFGNYISSGLSLNGTLRTAVNGTFVATPIKASYVVSSAADTTRLISAEGWPNVNDAAHGMLASDIISKQLEYTDLVVWSSTRATTLAGGQWGNGIYSCLTNTNGFFPIGRSLQAVCRSMNSVRCGLCPSSSDSPYISATVLTDAYTTGLKTSGNLVVVLTNKSSDTYDINVINGFTRPGNVVFTSQMNSAANTSTASTYSNLSQMSITTGGLQTTVSVPGYSVSGVVFDAYRKITSSPILVCPIDALNTTSPYGVWDTRTIIPGKPSGLSGFRDMKLSSFERFTDPATGIQSNVINCFYQIHSGGHEAANMAFGGLQVTSNPVVVPASNLAVFGDIFYDDNFNFGRGGKSGIGLFVGQEIAAGGNYKVNSSSARAIFRANGEASLYMYVPRNLQQKDPTMNTAAYATDNYGTEFFHRDTFRAVGNAGPLRRGCWNEVGIGVKVNSFVGNVPQYDGSVFLSINGVARELQEVRLLANTGNVYDNVSQYILNTFVGGDWTSPANSICRWANVRYYNYDVINQLQKP